MGGGYKINIMAASALKIDHGGCQLLMRVLAAFAPHADLVVLAKETPEVTMGEENGAGAPASYKRGLFAVMGEDAGYDEFRGRLTVTESAFRPVDPALARAERAGAKLFL